MLIIHQGENSSITPIGQHDHMTKAHTICGGNSPQYDAVFCGLSHFMDTTMDPGKVQPYEIY